MPGPRIATRWTARPAGTARSVSTPGRPGLRRVLRTTILVAAAWAVPTSASSRVFDDVGGWMIYETGPGACFASRLIGDGGVFQFGLNQSAGFVLAGSPGWIDLLDGRRHEFALTVGERAPWTGRATGMLLGEMRGSTLVFEPDTARRLFEQIRAERRIALSLRGTPRVDGDFPDMAAASRRVEACHRDADGTSILDAPGP